MTPVHVLLLAALAWVTWGVVAAMQRGARGEGAGVSIFPAIPFFPLAAWGLAVGLEKFHPGLGILLVGGGHGILLLTLLGSIARTLAVRGRAGKGR